MCGLRETMRERLKQQSKTDDLSRIGAVIAAVQAYISELHWYISYLESNRDLFKSVPNIEFIWKSSMVSRLQDKVNFSRTLFGSRSGTTGDSDGGNPAQGSSMGSRLLGSGTKQRRTQSSSIYVELGFTLQALAVAKCMSAYSRVATLDTEIECETINIMTPGVKDIAEEEGEKGIDALKRASVELREAAGVFEFVIEHVLPQIKHIRLNVPDLMPEVQHMLQMLSLADSDRLSVRVWLRSDKNQRKTPNMPANLLLGIQERYANAYSSLRMLQGGEFRNVSTDIQSYMRDGQQVILAQAMVYLAQVHSDNQKYGNAVGFIRDARELLIEVKKRNQSVHAKTAEMLLNGPLEPLYSLYRRNNDTIGFEAIPSSDDLRNEVENVTEQVSQLNTTDRPKVDADATEHEVEVRLADMQADPDSPLFSVKSFEELGLHENLLKGIYEMKFTKPSKIQERALPLLLANPARNMIGQSQSGTGKTAAFVLTMLSRVDYDINRPQALCLAPSRELARQIMEVVEQMGKYTPMKTKYAIKDSVQKGETIDAHIVIGTPGTVSDLIRKRALSLKDLKLFVLDEADNMLDQQGLGDQTLRIKKTAPKDCQIVLFSATFPDNVRLFTSRFAPDANEIRLKATELTVDGIKQFYMDCKSVPHKFEVLSELYSLMTVGQSIIFVRRRDTAERIAGRLNSDGHAVVFLHGTMDTVNRDDVMDKFRRGEIKVLITTNVIARGIDIQQVNLVINYDIPLTGSGVPDPETYLHRIGRTGRFGRTGASINFVHDEMSYEQMQAIQNTLGCDIIKVPTDDWEVAHKILKKALK
ncbi:RNA helicase required for poly(A+) mRNA export [Coemansia sp. RSA 989]|nr:RNA helicase required for poly(A+) mRNA export [Coemansia sp. RSA 989]